VVHDSGTHHTPLLILPFADAPLLALFFHQEPQRERHRLGHRPFAERVCARCAISDAKNLGGGDLAQAERFENGAIVVLGHAPYMGTDVLPAIVHCAKWRGRTKFWQTATTWQRSPVPLHNSLGQKARPTFGEVIHVPIMLGGCLPFPPHGSVAECRAYFTPAQRPIEMVRLPCERRGETAGPIRTHGLLDHDLRLFRR
jgi:hypothetical protein